MTRVSKPFHIALALAVGLVLLYLASVAVMGTDRFHRFLLAQVTTKLQEITGARVEISNLSFHAYSLQMTLHGLVLHGREASSQRALFSARTLVIGINPITILRRRLILRRFDLQNAAVYLRRYSDGSTNFPGPSLNGERVLRDFLSLSVTGLTISGTSFFWNDQVVPLDLSARNVILVLRRVPLRRYAGSFSCAQLSVARQKPGLPPLYLAGRIDFSRDDLDITGLEWRLLDGSLHTAGITGRGSVSVRRLPSFVAEASVRAEGGFSTLARLFEVHELTGGNFTLVTNTVYRNGQLQSRGHFQAREVEIRSPRFTPLRVALSSDYAADRAHLQFPNLRAAVLNG